MAHIRNVLGWEATDGHFEAEHDIARPEHKRLIRWEMGRATVTVGMNGEDFLSHLAHALSFPNLQGVVANEKLKLALELYAGHRFELSDNAQFISLVTSLEALLPDFDVSPAAMDAVGNAAALVRNARDQHTRESKEWTEIDRLLSRVNKLKYEAIGTSLRRFTESVIRRNHELGDPAAIATALREAYAVRSRLLHDGASDQPVIRTHLGFLRTFVPRLLQVLFEEASGARPAPASRNAP